ncbi:glycosyltransferase family 4 protein [Phenylobacterium sp. LjRoot219]|uniref:glycosyltransferase family 4 protein n=1 Tax=Phenylobacterium sp. LjRoot219 TaxID=3342283 RepID=UPI003ECFD298
MALRLMMTADAVGGVWTYALDLARGVAAAGGATTLVVLGPAPVADQLREARAIAGLRLIDTGLALDWTAEGPAELDASVHMVRELARDLRPDLVHLNSPALAPEEGLPAPVLGACHSCLATWWTAVKDGPSPSDFAWRTGALRRGMGSCDALVAPSRSFAAATAQTHGVAEPFVVHNGRRPSASGRREREPCVFTSGRLWDEGKNLAILDAAAALAGAPLYAAGPLEGPGGERVQPAHARALGRLGAEDISHWLGHAPIYASSALYEPFGLGVLEAAQAGCALVLSDIPTFHELWDDAAVFADPRRPDSFAGALAGLLADATERRRLGEAARSRAKRFTVEAMTAGLLDLYRRLGAAPPREAAA